MSSYEKKFRDGTVPEKLDLDGKYRVYLVGPLMPKLRFFLHRKVFRQGEGGIRGANEFLHLVQIAKFRVEKGKSLSDPTLDVVRIVYDDPANPFLVRPLVDEVRQIGPDEYLGQGMYKVLGRAFWAFWFLVRR